MLVMTCLLDVVAVPESALSVAKSRPNAWFVGLPECGHNMLNERGDDLVRLMSDSFSANVQAIVPLSAGSLREGYSQAVPVMSDSAESGRMRQSGRQLLGAARPFHVTTSFTALIRTTAACEFDPATSLLQAMLTCVSFPLHATG
jgi:hypothetical protein